MLQVFPAMSFFLKSYFGGVVFFPAKLVFSYRSLPSKVILHFCIGSTASIFKPPAAYSSLHVPSKEVSGIDGNSNKPIPGN